MREIWLVWENNQYFLYSVFWGFYSLWDDATNCIKDSVDAIPTSIEISTPWNSSQELHKKKKRIKFNRKERNKNLKRNALQVTSSRRRDRLTHPFIFNKSETFESKVCEWMRMIFIMVGIACLLPRKSVILHWLLSITNAFTHKIKIKIKIKLKIRKKEEQPSANSDAFQFSLFTPAFYSSTFHTIIYTHIVINETTILFSYS